MNPIGCATSARARPSCDVTAPAFTSTEPTALAPIQVLRTLKCKFSADGATLVRFLGSDGQVYTYQATEGKAARNALLVAGARGTLNWLLSQHYASRCRDLTLNGRDASFTTHDNIVTVPIPLGPSQRHAHCLALQGGASENQRSLEQISCSAVTSASSVTGRVSALVRAMETYLSSSGNDQSRKLALYNELRDCGSTGSAGNSALLNYLEHSAPSAASKCALLRTFSSGYGLVCAQQLALGASPPTAKDISIDVVAGSVTVKGLRPAVEKIDGGGSAEVVMASANASNANEGEMPSIRFTPILAKTLHSSPDAMGSMVLSLGCALDAFLERSAIYEAVMTRLVVNTALADELDEDEDERGIHDKPNSYSIHPPRLASAAEIEASNLLVVKEYLTILKALAPSARADAVAAFAEGKIPATPESKSQLCCVDQGILSLLTEAEGNHEYAGANVISWAPHV